MATIGDIIMEVRTLGPDLPLSTLSAPTVTAAGAVNGSLALGTYYFKATWVNPWGETAASAESSVTLTGSQGTITFTFPAYPTGAVNGRVYLGTAAGAENQWFATAASATSVSVTALNGTSGSPPTVNTAYLPDSDGGYVSAYSLYRWLNEALMLAAAASDGIIDGTGIQTVNGVGTYVLPGYWRKINRAWWDGLPVIAGRLDDFFNKSAVTGPPGYFGIGKADNVITLRLYPQPDRTGGSTTLSQAMGATDTVANVASTAGFLLPFGYANIGTETVEYSGMTATSLTGLIRGIGGTAAAPQSSGATVTEGNLRISGRRMPTTYTVGQSATTLPCPPGWAAKIATYILGKFRLSEHNAQEHARLTKEFYDWMNGPLSADRELIGPKQVGGGYGVETVGGTFNGGIIIP